MQNEEQSEMDKMLAEISGLANKAENNIQEQKTTTNVNAKHIEENETAIVKVEKTMISAGLYDDAWIAEKFSEYSKENPPHCYDYAKAFYWTILSLFDSYKLANTGAFQQITEAGDSKAEGLGIKVTHAVLGAAQSLPFIGGIFAIVDSAISGIYKEIKEMRIRAIMNIVQNNKDPKAQMKEQQSKIFALAALKLADLKRPKFQEMEFKKNQVPFNTGVEECLSAKVMRFILDKVDEVKHAMQDPLYETMGAQEALADVMITMTYFTKNSDAITNDTIPLDEAIVEIVQNKQNEVMSGADGNLGNISTTVTPQKDEEKDKQKTGCCELM